MGKGFGVCGLWFRVKGHGVQRLGSSMLGHRFSGFVWGSTMIMGLYLGVLGFGSVLGF